MQQKELEYIAWLYTQGYTDIKPLPGNRWAARFGFIYTCAIVIGRIGDLCGYDDRWCYHSSEAARKALEEWDGTGEPQGWHRHPPSGRRRPEGRMEEEYVAR